MPRCETVSVATAEINFQHVLNLALKIGYGLQKHGAETYRVEDSCSRVIKAYGAVNVEVFAIGNFISLSFDSPTGQTYISQKRVHSRADNLNRIDLLNHFGRHICSVRPNPAQALEEVERILTTQGYSYPTLLFASALVGFGFTLLVGGKLITAVCAAVISVLLKLLITPLQKQQTNRMFINIIGSMAITFMALPMRWLGLEDQMNYAIIGSFMYLFPGISLMNSIRDIVAGDFLAGMIKLIETILVAISIAVGSGIALALIHRF